jgi:hypothetical protein
MDTSQRFDAAEPVDPSAETVINGAPYVPDIRMQLAAAAERYQAAQRDTVGG